MIDLNDVIDELKKIELQRFHWAAVASVFELGTPEVFIEDWIKRTTEDLVLEAFHGRRAVIAKPEVLREQNGLIVGVQIRVLTMPMVGGE